MTCKPIFYLTLALIGLSMIDNGKPPRIPLFQVKETAEVVAEQRPDGDA